MQHVSEDVINNIFCTATANCYHTMGQIIKSQASVCYHSYGRNCYSIIMIFCTVIWGPKSKTKFVMNQNLMTLPLFCSNFHPHNAFSMGRSEYCSNKARGPSAAVNRSNGVSQEAAMYP